MKKKGKLELLTVVGNRPQFIKMGPVSAELRRRGHDEFVVHTGQHYDDNMSRVFFEELGLPKPNVQLVVNGRTHGRMTGELLAAIEQILVERRPRGLLIYGDTNSTLAAALAAVKLQIPIAHVEAGPRVYDMTTPEEINRLVADHAAALRFCPDRESVRNLKKENIVAGVHFTGDVMYDAFRAYKDLAIERARFLDDWDLRARSFALMTIHRPNNTDSVSALTRVVELLERSPCPIVFVVHPRTEAALRRDGLWQRANSAPLARVVPALGYLEILALLSCAQIVLTDSGGLQKEAYFAGKPVCVLFYTTPWPKIQASGWQRCFWREDGIDVNGAVRAIRNYRPKTRRPKLFGDGRAAQKVVAALEREWLPKR